jgi:integrase
MAQRLTAAHIRNAKPKAKPYKLADGNGLYLLVKPSGSRLWRYKYRIDSRENVFAVGRYPQISLQQARESRENAYLLVKRGTHPASERAVGRLSVIDSSANTFSSLANEWVERNRARWSAYYLSQVQVIMADNVMPSIGRLPIKMVTANQLLTIVKKVEVRGAATVALLIRQWCSAIFRYAISTLRADGDPAAALKGAIDRPKVKHRRALSAKHVGLFARQLGSAEGGEAIKIGLEILLLTFVRPGELRGAMWDEIDLNLAEWRIPAERMKMDTPHTIPLSQQVVKLFKRLKTVSTGLPQVFPNARDSERVMSPTTFNRFLERMGYAGRLSAHGFRATASTILNEKGFRSDVIERQLAHQERDKVRASYNHAEYLPERRKMMQDWADFVDMCRKTADTAPSVAPREQFV